MIFSLDWWRAAAIRAARTFAQALLAECGAGLAFSEIAWPRALSVAGVAAVLSILTSLAGLPEVEDRDITE